MAIPLRPLVYLLPFININGFCWLWEYICSLWRLFEKCVVHTIKCWIYKGEKNKDKSCVAFCKSLSALSSLLSFDHCIVCLVLLWFTNSDYLFGIFTLLYGDLVVFTFKTYTWTYNLHKLLLIEVNVVSQVKKTPMVMNTESHLRLVTPYAFYRSGWILVSLYWGCRGCDRIQLNMQPASITTNVVSSNPTFRGTRV